MSTPLELVLDRIRNTLSSEGCPIAIFDLDSTLLSTQERNHAILREFAVAPGAPAELVQVVERIGSTDMGWNVMEDLRRAGFTQEPVLARLREFWLERFFSNAYLRHDIPIPGAVEFVREIHDAGAIVYYLTGRDEPGMGIGTRMSLREHGFPLERSRVFLRLKPTFEEEDLAFKQRAIEDLRRLGEVVAAFENEPVNANLFYDSFPGAQVLFVETVCSPNPPPLRPGILRLKDFLGRGKDRTSR